MKFITKSLDKLRKKPLFPYEIPDLTQLVGRMVKIDGSLVKIDHITGNNSKVHFAEINGQHLISFLDLFAQMNGEEVSKEDIDAFNDIILNMQPPKQKKPSLS